MCREGYFCLLVVQEANMEIQGSKNLLYVISRRTNDTCYLQPLFANCTPFPLFTIIPFLFLKDYTLWNPFFFLEMSF